MNPLTGMLKMHYRDKWTWLFTPWIILLSSFLVNVILATTMEDSMYSGGVVSIFIYMLVAGIIVLAQTFPFTLGLSTRRTDYFIGTSFMAIIISAIFSLLLFLLAFTEGELTGGWGIGLHYFHLPYINDGTALEQFLIYFAIMLHMFYLGFIISSIFRRFGRNGLFLAAGIAFVLGSIGSYFMTYFAWWGDLFHWITGHTAFELALWSIPLTVVYAALSFGLLRKSTV